MSSSPPPPDREAETIAWLRAESQEGIRRLVADHGGVVKDYLQRTFGRFLDSHDLEVALSSGVIGVWENRFTFDPRRGTLVHLFLVCARNEALTLLMLRRRAQRTSVPLEKLQDELATRPCDPDSLQLQADLHRCIQRLRRRERQVLMADLQAGGRADSEWLAGCLRLRVETIHSIRARAKARLVRMMAQLGHAVPGRHPPETSLGNAAPEFG